MIPSVPVLQIFAMPRHRLINLPIAIAIAIGITIIVIIIVIFAML